MVICFEILKFLFFFIKLSINNMLFLFVLGCSIGLEYG